MVAVVQKPAPTFKADAVIDGLFHQISLSDYIGQWYSHFTALLLVARSRSVPAGSCSSSTQCECPVMLRY